MSRIVQIDDTGIPEGVIRIADQLPAGDELSPGETVTLRFTHAFLYLTGLVLLAAWRKALPAHARVVIDDSSASPETQRFLTNTGFREVIETGTYHPSAPSRIGKVPIQAILKGREKEATVNEIVRIFDEYAGQVLTQRRFVFWSANCARTSWPIPTSQRRATFVPAFSKTTTDARSQLLIPGSGSNRAFGAARMKPPSDGSQTGKARFQ